MVRAGGRAGYPGSATMCEERDLLWTCMAECLSGHCFSHSQPRFLLVCLPSIHRSETMGYESSGSRKGDDKSGPCQQLGRRPHTTAAILNRQLVDVRNPSKSLSVFFSI